MEKKLCVDLLTLDFVKGNEKKFDATHSRGRKMSRKFSPVRAKGRSTLTPFS
jgi:hypothetical protein